MPDVNSSILIATVLSNGWLAVLVWRMRQRTMSAQLFLVMVALIILWAVANYAIDTSTTGAEALFWTRSLYVFALGYISAFYVFAFTFARNPLPRPGLYSGLLLILMLGAIVMTLESTLVFSNASLGPSGLNTLTFGPLYLSINLFGLLVAGSGIGLLMQTAHGAGRTIVRDQAVLIIVGWVLFLGLVIFVAAILPYFFPLLVIDSKIAPLFSIIMIACTTYAIVRHRFLDVTPLIRRGFVYTLLLTTVLCSYIALLYGLRHLFHIDSEAVDFVASMLTICIGILGAQPIERYFRRQTNRFFFKDTYEYGAALEELCHLLNTTVRMPQLVALSIEKLSHILKPERVEFAHSKTSERYGAYGERVTSGDYPSVKEDGLVISITTENHAIGEFLLWPKRSGDPYTKEDKMLLRTFAIQAAVALEKAELYEQLKEYSEHLEEKVQDRTKHLEDLRASQREFMDDISHALQTPLTVLSSTIDGLAQSRHTKLARQSINKLSRLIQNLLTLAWIEALPETETAVPFNLSNIVENLAEYVGVVSASKDIKLQTNITKDIWLTGNQTQFEEAITNILSNAVRYTAGCSVRNITTSLVRTGEDISLSITDSGIGIEARLLPHIFERFYRAQNTKGSGIGLAITKRILERHGATISVASKLGYGTTFTVTFPLEKF